MPEQVTRALVPARAGDRARSRLCAGAWQRRDVPPLPLSCAPACRRTTAQLRSSHARAAIAARPGRRTGADARGVFDRHGRRTIARAAFTALEAALAISPSIGADLHPRQRHSRLGRRSERAIEWSERGMRLSPFDSWAFAAFDAQAIEPFPARPLRGSAGARPTSPSRPIPPTASPTCNWPRRWPSLDGWRKRGRRRAGARAASDLPLRPPVQGRELRSGACGSAWRSAAGGRTAE